MLIRCKGYNTGVKEYLEEGIKVGREYSRDELDHRMILDGDLDLTQLVYEGIPDKGQDRYLSFTLSFAEDEVPVNTLRDITREFKHFMMNAYHEDEYNFYSEAHLPKIKQQINRKTGELEDRKPHIHIVIPRKNLLTGKEANPVGEYEKNVAYFEAFQEHINQKYQLVSPRERIRADPQDAASVLSRYKGDDFRTKNRQFKTDLVRQVIERDVRTRADFYQLVGQHGETRIRNKGKPTEYIAVKLPGDAKFTNLKETIFQDDFVVHRELKKDPLPAHVIEQRLQAWPERAREIKYIEKEAGPSVRKRYYATPAEERPALLAERIERFYRPYGDEYGHLHHSYGTGVDQRGADEAVRTGSGATAVSLQGLSRRDVDADGQGGERTAEVLLPADARLHVANEGRRRRDPGLRSAVSAGRRGKLPTSIDGRQRQHTAGSPSGNGGEPRRGTSGDSQSIRRARSHSRVEPPDLPPYARNPNRPAFVDDVSRHTERILRSMQSPPPSNGIRVRVINSAPSHRARESSTPVAYAIRQHEQNRLKPAERRALRQINQRFYETRRLVRADSRFTRQERAQLVAVLVFERMKAKQAVTHPQQQESKSMRSAEIRALVTQQDRRLPDNSISGSAVDQPEPARERMRRLVGRLSEVLEEYKSSGRTQADGAQDMYTKRARFSQNVHYLDKSSDKTVFVDAGKSINLRRHGMSEAGVSVALDLARERFGSTLTIKGSEEFKRTIVDVAATRGLDVHFTDPQMNRRLAERKAELAIEQEGLTIERGTATAPAAVPAQAIAPQVASPALATVIKGKLLEHGAAPYQNDPTKDESYFLKLQTEQGERTLWGKDFKQLMEQGQYQAGERIALRDHGTEAVAVTHQHADGSTEQKTAQRRSWSVERDVEVSAPADSNRSARRFEVHDPRVDAVSVYETEAEAQAGAEKSGGGSYVARVGDASSHLVKQQPDGSWRSDAPAAVSPGKEGDRRLSADKILLVAGSLREAGFHRESDVFAEASFNQDRWPDALASLRALAKHPKEACPDASQWSKEVAFRMYENVERDLFKLGIDYQTVADTGRVVAPPTQNMDDDISF